MTKLPDDERPSIPNNKDIAKLLLFFFDTHPALSQWIDWWPRKGCRLRMDSADLEEAAIMQLIGISWA